VASLDMKDIVHFACHGVSDAKSNDLESYLVFQEPYESQNQSPSPPLPDNPHVRRAFEDKLKRAKTAYLSARSSATIFPGGLVGEAVHLVSAFLAAGFRYVFRALGMTHDNICVEMAKSFCEEYCDLRKWRSRDNAVAFALHSATVRVREKMIRRPPRLAPYIHHGP
jgi:CHAT domain-containing protein